MNTDLFEVISASSIILNAEILNGFPAEMSLSVEPFDVDGNKIEGLEVMIPSKINASETTELTENVVPAKTKAQAIFDMLNGEIGEKCPATALRNHDNAKLYLDADSSALLK